MKCYVINLDRSVDRLSHVRSVFSDLNIEFERVSGVDGRSISTFDQKALVELAPGQRALTPSEIGCFLSHKKCFDLIAKSDDEYACVFEDDIIFSPEIVDWLGTTNWIPNNSDIIRLQTVDSKATIGYPIYKSKDGRKLSRLLGRYVGTGGYIISKRCAERLLTDAAKATAPIDEMMFNPDFGIFGDLVIYQFSPALCVEAGLPSTIERQNASVTRINVTARMIRETTRPVQQVAKIVRNFVKRQSWQKYHLADNLVVRGFIRTSCAQSRLKLNGVRIEVAQASDYEVRWWA